MNRDCKDVIAFEPADYLAVVEKLQLDLHEPPMSQVSSNFTMISFCMRFIGFCFVFFCFFLISVLL